jgi:AcrR family transcriptional regulator
LPSGLNGCSAFQNACCANFAQRFEDTHVPANAVAAVAAERYETPMVYRRTHQVMKRLAARRSAILKAARDTASESGMAAVQIAPVAIRASVAAGTVYRYFPSKADLISELITEVSRGELAAIRRAADAAPGPSSALAAAVATVAMHMVSHRKLAWGILAEPIDVDVAATRLASRREIAGEIEARIIAAVRVGHLPAQDTALAATALLGALHESLVGPLAPDNLDDPAKLRDVVQTTTLLALRAVGVTDARARGLVVQAALPARMPAGEPEG